MDNRIPLRFTPQQLDYIASTLGARPWTEVQALLVDIRNQVEQYNLDQLPKAASELPTIEPTRTPVQ